MLPIHQPLAIEAPAKQLPGTCQNKMLLRACVGLKAAAAVVAKTASQVKAAPAVASAYPQAAETPAIPPSAAEKNEREMPVLVLFVSARDRVTPQCRGGAS